MVMTQRLLFFVQLGLLALLSSAMQPLTQAWFAVLLLTKAYQLTHPAHSVWSVRTANLLAIAGISCFLMLYQQLGVVHLMIHFLYFAAVLRLLSIRFQQHDVAQLLLVHYLLFACCFILQQQLWFALVVTPFLILNLIAQWLWASGEAEPQWQFPTRPIALSMVLMLLLFVIAPRLSPFWQVPSPKVAKTGLSEVMSANSIDQLLTSDELAFRVSFDDNNQALNTAMYFRSRIYNTFDGNEWQSSFNQRPLRFDSTLPRIRYQVIAEPHQQQWLFGLGSAVDIKPSDIFSNQHGLLVRQQPLAQRIAYQVSSIDAIPKTERSLQAFLQLPNTLNPKTLQLAQQSILQGHSTALIVRRFSELVASGDYRYTLSPGAMTSPHAVDEFLFSRKRGFCVHYAQAATVFLRAAGVPARMVGGYLGGQWQANDRYLRVSQANAHAWVEYLENNQWKRYDPTLLIYPELTQQNASLQQGGLLQQLGGDFWSPGHFGGMLIQWVQDLDYYWASYVLSFEKDDQQLLQDQLKQWLQQHWQTLTVTLGALLLVALGYWRYVGWRRLPLPQRLLGPLWAFKQPQESVDRLLERLALANPQYQAAIRQLQQDYHRAVYQRAVFQREVFQGPEHPQTGGSRHLYQQQTHQRWACWWQSQRLYRRLQQAN